MRNSGLRLEWQKGLISFRKVSERAVSALLARTMFWLDLFPDGSSEQILRFQVQAHIAKLRRQISVIDGQHQQLKPTSDQ
ncbi:hypothetical protein CK203_022324 [Vitis vinifera]|uniref:Uncharacterized protein n=1 Tax=Vitis vinifera TaxID=29760 RepID=A0A438DMB9_VITVI|nr:hypothetical protein CK203_072797 [Vitis vinifera]RVW93310.1 hypothetical protein CK203_022324 [Vitis vinifera]